MNIDEFREAEVAHIVGLFQVDPDFARDAVARRLKIESYPLPKLGHHVKDRLAELGIETPPPKPAPWYLQPPDKDGWRFKPNEA